jgi:hypothetical protein
MLAALALGCAAVWLMLRFAGGRRASGRLTKGRRLPDGVAFLVLALGFTLFRVGELYLRPRALGATEPVWFYPVLYGAVIAFVVAVLLRRTAERSAAAGAATRPPEAAP